ncbi:MULTISPECIES: tetratricopeptide repeat protein [unclassified Salipiger]|uniref:tetratricopeptide repeat protein n=1 Tax=unclassified Salipiger TaxID=2640570 RepID=UPI0013BE25FE|nr:MULTISPECIES: tetratricopeptide repeat protein [unclassified Salipiger]NDV50717.1 tetratricopeptide repeat protein [Salipiger sp. PrR003]NDW33161.1 tetratricopeptide repeat protein [Salipiger sp. PrR007]
MSGKAFGTLRGTVLALALMVAGAGAVSADSLSGDYLAARQASFAGDFKAAARYYGEAVKHDPENADLLERAALANIGLGDFVRAEALAERLTALGHSSQIGQLAEIAVLAHEENYAELLKRIEEGRSAGALVDGLLKAWAELGRGDVSAALASFDAVAEERGLAGFAAYHKAMALASVGDFEGAEAIFADPAGGGMQMTRSAVLARIQILSQINRQSDAVSLIDEAFGQQLDPGMEDLRAKLEAGETLPFDIVTSARDGIAEVFFTIAGALANESAEDYTLLHVRVAEYLRPDHVGALLMAGELLEKMGQYELAAATYRRVPREDAAYHVAELGRSDALRAEGKLDAAVEVLEQLADTHGNLPAVQSALGDLMRQLERYGEAITAYDRALATFAEPDPAQWFLYYARGICKERDGNWEAAEKDFRAALEFVPNQPQVLNYLGYSMVEHHVNLDEALEMIERAVEAEPQSGYIVDSLGWALYRLGRYDEAVGHMERAAELMAVDPVVNDHLGDVYWAVGRKTEARFQWQRALSFVGWEDASDDVEPERIRRKLAVGLDTVLAEEGRPPLKVAHDVE